MTALAITPWDVALADCIATCRELGLNTFAELHDHYDANEWILEALGDHPGDQHDKWVELGNLFGDQVDAELAEEV